MGGETIPGCKGAGGGKDWDYCYDPKTEVKKTKPCAKNNGGCDSKRKCTNSNGKAKCGNCPKGYTNLGATKCKKTPAPTKPSKGKKIVSYQVPDKRSGCPGKLAANQALISKKITVSEASYVVATGHMIRRYSGRADLHLRLNNKIIDYSLTYLYRGNTRLDLSLSYTSGKQWADVQ